MNKTAMSIAVVSSSYGGYDIQDPVPEQTIPCEWIMVSDSDEGIPSPWKVVVERRPSVPPRLASRVAKCNPWLYTDAEIVIWKDSNIRILSSSFIELLIDGTGDKIFSQRPLRQNALDELSLTRTLRKWDGDPIEEMLDSYVADGYPLDYGIWWCGLIVQSRASRPDFGDWWLHEMVKWTCQDQFSYSYILWKLGLMPESLSVNGVYESHLHEFGNF